MMDRFLACSAHILASHLFAWQPQIKHKNLAKFLLLVVKHYETLY